MEIYDMLKKEVTIDYTCIPDVVKYGISNFT
jgi:hypothetical protein